MDREQAFLSPLDDRYRCGSVHTDNNSHGCPYGDEVLGSSQRGFILEETTPSALLFLTTIEFHLLAVEASVLLVRAAA